MKAIISDIHANLEALEVALDDIKHQGIDEIICLGDIVGYGPDPEACVDLVMENCSVCLMGNHDWAVLNEPFNFNRIAAEAIYRTQDKMKPNLFSSPEKKKRWEFLENLPLTHAENGILYVHASPRDPLTEYIMPSDVIYDIEKLMEIFDAIDRACFVGHTHVPGIITENLEFLNPPDIENHYNLGDSSKVIINDGSIGQPRDGDNRLSYVTTVDGEVHYHRLEYNYHETMEKIKKIGYSTDYLAERLAAGA